MLLAVRNNPPLWQKTLLTVLGETRVAGHVVSVPALSLYGFPAGPFFSSQQRKSVNSVPLDVSSMAPLNDNREAPGVVSIKG